jgi:hypothetical protein
LQGFLCRIGLSGSHHLDEPEATALTSVRVTHDVALLDLAVFLKQTRDFIFGKTRVDAGHEKVGAGIGSILVIIAAFRWWCIVAGAGISERYSLLIMTPKVCIPVTTTTHGLITDPGVSITFAFTFALGRSRAITSGIIAVSIAVAFVFFRILA